MTDVDFRSLLDTKWDDVKKPPTWPAGTYHGVIARQQYGRQQNEKKTPYAEQFITITEPGEDVAEQCQELGIDVAKRQVSTKLWLSEDAQYRVKEVLHSCGIDTAGRGFGETLPELIGKSVLVEITQRPRRSRDGTVDIENMVNEVGNIRGEQE